MLGQSTLVNAIFPYEDLHEEHELLLSASPYDYFSIINGVQPQPFITFDKPQALEVGFDARIFLPKQMK